MTLRKGTDDGVERALNETYEVPNDYETLVARQARLQQAADAARKMAAVNKPDKLDEIFALQKALNDRIISDRDIEKTTDEWVRDITVAMESEIDEIRREINWKWWKNPKPIDREALNGEIIDLWHFLVMLSLMVGLSADDVIAGYREKNAENHARQDGTSDKDGYSIED